MSGRRDKGRMKTINPKSYERWASALIRKGRAVSFAKRYLQTVRRRRVLKEGIQLAAADAMRNNPLALISFVPPLSVAGCNSNVIVRAEKMRMDGVPIAIEKDGKNRHRGTPIDDVIDALHAETETLYGELHVLDMYRQSIMGHPSRLQFHSEPRFRKIPRLLLRLDRERVDLEDVLRRVILKEYDDSLFTATVDALSLRSAIIDSRESVVVGCDGKQIRIDGKPVRTSRARGRGLATVAVRNLRSLAASDDKVGIECRLSGWVGVADNKRRKFRYYGSEQ